MTVDEKLRYDTMLYNDAKCYTAEYAMKNKCFATFDIRCEFHGYKDDNYIHEVLEYCFYARNNGTIEAIEDNNLESLIQKIKKLINQE